MERKTPDADDPHRSLEGALHEVSNALTVLLGWVNEARASGADPQAVAYALGIVEHRARAARDLARRAIGAPVPPSGDAPLAAVVSDVCETLRLEAARRGHLVVCSGDAGGLAVPLAEDVAHILTNLILNAVAYAPDGSAIGVAVASRPGASAIEIEVRDGGPGVEPSRRERLFEGDSTRAGGAGVGLRHSRALARCAGGDLQLVTTEAGAVFRLTWPVAEPEPIAMPVRSAPRLAVLAGTKILVLDDDPDVTDLLHAALSARGADVTIACSRRELDERIDVSHDAILVDLSPIAADVLGAMAFVRSRAPDVAVVFITGSAESLPEGLVGAWVRKPFEISELVAAVLGESAARG